MAGVEVHLSADGGSVAAVREGVAVADGRVRPGRLGWDLTVSSTGRTIDRDVLVAVLDRLRVIVERASPGPATLRWLVSDPTRVHDEAAARAGLHDRRDLLQIRRPLPVEPDLRAGLPPIRTRPFLIGDDEDRWLRCNNRSFADHPDQSGQTRADLARLEGQPWFDAGGFLLLDAAADGPRPGELDGFCWTKVHADHDPPLGEIFVIGVDPAAHGRRLGPALTVAGLDHLASRGLTVGMLYVDVANETATRMYDRLGFTTHHLDRIYSGGG